MLRATYNRVTTLFHKSFATDSQKIRVNSQVIRKVRIDIFTQFRATHGGCSYAATRLFRVRFALIRGGFAADSRIQVCGYAQFAADSRPIRGRFACIRAFLVATQSNMRTDSHGFALNSPKFPSLRAAAWSSIRANSRAFALGSPGFAFVGALSLQPIHGQFAADSRSICFARADLSRVCALPTLRAAPLCARYISSARTATLNGLFEK